MTILQAFIIAMSLTGQVLVAKKDRRGYLAWIVGNVALMVVYRDTGQLGLIFLPLVNCAIQTAALISWSKVRLTSRRMAAVIH